mgnify:CR=1 FL=1
MSKVRRVYVEKKDAYAVRAKELHAEIKSYLGISAVDKVRVLIRYDIENISDDVYKRAVQTVFSEPPVDDVSLNICHSLFLNDNSNLLYSYLPAPMMLSIMPYSSASPDVIQ